MGEKLTCCISLSLSLREGKGKFPKSQAWEWKEGWGGGEGVFGLQNGEKEEEIIHSSRA